MVAGFTCAIRIGRDAKGQVVAGKWLGAKAQGSLGVGLGGHHWHSSKTTGAQTELGNCCVRQDTDSWHSRNADEEEGRRVRLPCTLTKCPHVVSPLPKSPRRALREKDA